METGFLLISGPDLYTSEKEWRAISGKNQASEQTSNIQQSPQRKQSREPTNRQPAKKKTTSAKKRLGRWRPNIPGATTGGVSIGTRRKTSGRQRRKARSRGSATSSHSQGETSSSESESESESEGEVEDSEGEENSNSGERRILADGHKHPEAKPEISRIQSAGTRSRSSLASAVVPTTGFRSGAAEDRVGAGARAGAKGKARARSGAPTRFGTTGAGAETVGAVTTPVHPANATASAPSNNGRRATALGAGPEPGRPATKTASNFVGRHGDGAPSSPGPGPGEPGGFSRSGTGSRTGTGKNRGRVGAGAAAAPAGPSNVTANVHVTGANIDTGQVQAATTTITSSNSGSLKSAYASPATGTTTPNNNNNYNNITNARHQDSKSFASPSLAWPSQSTTSTPSPSPFAAKKTQSSPGDNDCQPIHTSIRGRETSAAVNATTVSTATASSARLANPIASASVIESTSIAEPPFTSSTVGDPPYSPNILSDDSNAGLVASVGTAALAHPRADSNDQTTDKTPNVPPPQSPPHTDPTDRKNHTTARLQKRPRKLSLRIGSHLQSAGLLSPIEKPLPITPTSPLTKSLGDRPHQHDQSGQGAVTFTKPPSSVLATRSENMSAPPPAARSGANLTTSNSNGAPVPGSSTEGSIAPSVTSSHPTSSKPFVIKNNRAFLPDQTMPYPLPVDLPEMHRQSLRTLLMFQLFNGPVTSPFLADNPPTRVLEVGCGSGFWSMMCHRYFSQHGHTNISFTGLDIVPMATFDSAIKPDKDMQWHFVQHDLRRFPWPFEDNTFDLVISKDLALCVSDAGQQEMIDETIRVMAPGGVLEVWEADHTIRMLRPHVPKMVGSNEPASSTADGDESGSDEEDEATKLGAYVLTSNTPLSAPLNSYLVDYNSWVTKAFTQRGISPVPTTLVGPNFVQETDFLGDLCSKRLAIPLSEIRWEREGVGGVVTKDGKSYIDTTKGKGRVSESKRNKAGGKVLTPAQAALRRTALETVVDQIQSLETVLREVTRKSQDEWDGWCGKMMNELLNEGGTSWGECLEVGAWSARKKFPTDK